MSLNEIKSFLPSVVGALVGALGALLAFAVLIILSPRVPAVFLVLFVLVIAVCLGLSAGFAADGFLGRADVSHSAVIAGAVVLAVVARPSKWDRSN